MLQDLCISPVVVFVEVYSDPLLKYEDTSSVYNVELLASGVNLRHYGKPSRGGFGGGAFREDMEYNPTGTIHSKMFCIRNGLPDGRFNNSMSEYYRKDSHFMIQSSVEQFLSRETRYLCLFDADWVGLRKMYIIRKINSEGYITHFGFNVRADWNYLIYKQIRDHPQLTFEQKYSFIRHMVITIEELSIHERYMDFDWAFDLFKHAVGKVFGVEIGGCIYVQDTHLHVEFVCSNMEDELIVDYINPKQQKDINLYGICVKALIEKDVNHRYTSNYILKNTQMESKCMEDGESSPLDIDLDMLTTLVS